MKRWFLFTLIMPLVLAACGSGNGGFGEVIATVPPPTSCANGSPACNAYGQYPGYAPYYGAVYYGGNFCDCPVGYRPVYNGQMGIGCVTAVAFDPYSYGAAYWGWGANNNQWVNIPQVSNTQGYPSSNSCYQNVAQSCFIDQYNACGANYTCQVTAGGSRLGVCVKNGTTTSGGATYR